MSDAPEYEGMEIWTKHTQQEKKENRFLLLFTIFFCGWILLFKNLCYNNNVFLYINFMSWFLLSGKIYCYDVWLVNSNNIHKRRIHSGITFQKKNQFPKVLNEITIIVNRNISIWIIDGIKSQNVWLSVTNVIGMWKGVEKWFEETSKLFITLTNWGFQLRLLFKLKIKELNK